MFEDLYDPRVLDFPFYVSLGNHDYQENRYVIEAEYARANPDSRWKFPSRWYRVDLPRDKPIVSVLMLDSNQPLLGQELWNEELAWIKSELSKPRKSKWLIAVAHHPFFSNGDHGDNGVLRNARQPLFEKAKLDLYLCGHDHDLQHLEVANFRESFMVVGGGGASTRPMRVDRRGPFSKSAHGFADLNFTNDRMTARLIGDDGAALHEFTRTRDGKVEVTRNTPSDLAV